MWRNACGWMVLAAVLAGAAAPHHLTAQQRIRQEFGPQAIALFPRTTAVAGGVYGAVRPSTRLRISLFAGGGRAGDHGYGRGELLLHFLLAPERRRGVGAYVAGGAGVDGGRRYEARIVALAGLEGSPGARQGWIVEGGVGGGWRFVAGWRWRR